MSVLSSVEGNTVGSGEMVVVVIVVIVGGSTVGSGVCLR